MSFYIGFIMKDLVVLASDRKFCVGDDYIEGKKLFRIKKNIYGVHLGWEIFGRAWIEYFKQSPIFSESFVRFARWFININYICCKKKLQRQGRPLEGFTSITFGGFSGGKAFIHHLDSKDNFRLTTLCEGSIYNALNEDSKDIIDAYIKNVTQLLGFMQNQNIELRKDFLKKEVKKIMFSLSSRFPCISSNADIVFITEDDSVCGSLQ